MALTFSLGVGEQKGVVRIEANVLWLKGQPLLGSCSYCHVSVQIKCWFFLVSKEMQDRQLCMVQLPKNNFFAG